MKREHRQGHQPIPVPFLVTSINTAPIANPNSEPVGRTKSSNRSRTSSAPSRLPKAQRKRPRDSAFGPEAVSTQQADAALTTRK